MDRSSIVRWLNAGSIIVSDTNLILMLNSD
jgi:hypothetical protein